MAATSTPASTPASTAARTAPRRAAVAARLRAALSHPGFLTGLAALAMLGGAPMAALPVVAADNQR
jgi:hypothetical protein